MKILSLIVLAPTVLDILVTKVGSYLTRWLVTACYSKGARAENMWESLKLNVLLWGPYSMDCRHFRINIGFPLVWNLIRGSE